MSACQHASLTEVQIDLRVCDVCGELMQYFAEDIQAWVDVI